MALAGVTFPPLVKAQEVQKEGPGWDRGAAAQYLDDRIDLWFERATELRTGEAKTSCISCHTVVPYLLARPALRKTMRSAGQTPQESRLLKEMAHRVGTYPNHESLSDSKHGGGKHGTEAVLNALVLAQRDAEQRKQDLSETTRKAFRQLWDTQAADGAWDWMDFGEEPDESADARYHGTAMAAIAVGTAPGLAGTGDADIEGYVGKMRAYLNGKYAEQNLYNRAWMLLASTRLTGLLNRDLREVLIAELRSTQNGDGGWSLYKLGPWRWSKASLPFAPPGQPDALLLEKSDGYATGLIAYALCEAGLPANEPTLQRAAEWLKGNQKEVQIDQHVWKCWQTHSLNHDRENGGARGGVWKRMFMSDTATAFAVLALSSLK